ncbi:hypothetical protein POX_a00464 [Penicillium oxalicum]|uniref:Uncharacterized protein n=1 Tax=Penicillium oxalicum (strain 114-2 / CGMCC 5302) TaxID=933388 RepID=S8B6M7_PENO1|nr:hypothetical protein POX_a00464 [Penicillium oxalicum]EPS34563.1 hypothetical protein PDE_09527 [Penicillium oxalicum 114-2]KAI2793876.1 hypothetical protein POX_a00464 [Penicillium oxalicum]
MTTEFRIPIHQGPPARKPVTHSSAGYAYPPYDAPRNFSSHSAYAPSTHSRTRTTSSSVLPGSVALSSQYPGGPGAPMSQQAMGPPGAFPPSRRLSSTTTSTNSTGHMTQSGLDIRRSASNRSAGSQLGYVALMRRQKATVWCDRAQPEDARMREQALRDKKRAYLEVHGSGRASTIASGKIRHGTKAGMDFSPSNLVSARVPVRLSANEIGEEGDDARSTEERMMHRRTGSGRSSVGSNRVSSGYQRQPGTMGSNSTPPNEKSDLPGVSENTTGEKYAEEKTRLSSLKDDAATTHTTNSSEQDDFVPDMEAPSAATSAAHKAKKVDDLRRRGSVDDRTTSMTNVRLFVANPDLSD